MRKLAAALAVILCLAVGALTVHKLVKVDKEPPVINFGHNISFSDELSEEELLRGVTARDSVDGDVTDSIVLESVSLNDEDATVVVTYAARDNSNNVARASRILEYSNEKKESVGFEENTEADSADGMEEEPETESETESEELPPGSPHINLSEKQVEIHVGDSFEPLNYVESVEDDNDNIYDLWQNIRISGEYDVQKEGTYELFFYVIDSAGNTSNQAKLELVVKS